MERMRRVEQPWTDRQSDEERALSSMPWLVLEAGLSAYAKKYQYFPLYSMFQWRVADLEVDFKAILQRLAGCNSATS